LFIWSEYIDPAIVRDFEQEFDCKVVLDLYEEEAAMIAKLSGGGAAQYDVVVPPNHTVTILVKLKLLAPLRHANIPNLKNIDDRFINPPFDPGNTYSVAYQWGTMGIYLRKPKAKPVDETWGLLFDPKKQTGSFILLDSMRDMLGCALIYLGHSLNTTDPIQLKAARDLLSATKTRAMGFEGGVGGKNKVLAKTVTAAVVYSGDAIRGMNEDPETYYFIPREGSQIWVDNLAVPAKAPHRDLAEKFINFILRADIGARLANFNKYATPNKSALPKIVPKDLKNPSIYPPPELMPRLEFVTDLGKNTRLYDEIWTQVKAR
jgi:spermidine/putrescine transport system substrate-binding protein